LFNLLLSERNILLLPEIGVASSRSVLGCA
jgi:hypothetical protein